MKRNILLLLLCLAPALPMLPQSANDPNEGSRITYNPLGGTATISWWARSGFTYRVQWSENLMTWIDYGEVLGASAPAELMVPLMGNPSRMFLRLQRPADNDNDGISDDDEVNIYNTNPFDRDTNHDGARWVGEDIPTFPNRAKITRPRCWTGPASSPHWAAAGW